MSRYAALVITLFLLVGCGGITKSPSAGQPVEPTAAEKPETNEERSKRILREATGLGPFEDNPRITRLLEYKIPEGYIIVYTPKKNAAKCKYTDDPKIGLSHAMMSEPVNYLKGLFNISGEGITHPDFAVHFMCGKILDDRVAKIVIETDIDQTETAHIENGAWVAVWRKDFKTRRITAWDKDGQMLVEETIDENGISTVR
jgi:hypothetical protein